MELINRVQVVRFNPFFELNFDNVVIHRFDYHAVNSFPVNILVFVLEDSGSAESVLTNRLSGEKYVFRKNHLYFIPADLTVRFDFNRKVTFLALHFSVEFFSGMDIFSGMRNCIVRKEPEMARQLQEIVRHEDDLRTICALKSKVMEFCLSVWPENLHELKRAASYRDVFSYIRNHIDATLTVGRVAEAFEQNRDVFSRNFIRDLKQSPKRYLQRELLKQCIAWLTRPETSIKECADKLKFSSEFYFSRFVKKWTGIPPSQLRFNSLRQRPGTGQTTDL